MINGKDVLKGKNAIDCYYYKAGVYWYQTENKQWHKINLNKE